jgi:hypothetical protein
LNRRTPPKEDAAVPIVPTVPQKLLGRFQVWLLQKPTNAGSAGEIGKRITAFQISVSGLRPGGANADRHDPGRSRLENRKRLPQACCERISIRDVVVGGKDSHDRFRVQPLQLQRGKPYGRGGIPSERLKKEIRIRELRELLPNEAGMRPAGRHQYPRPRQQKPRTINRRLKKGLSPDQPKKRLGACLCTQRPESLSPPAGQYDGEDVSYPHERRASPSLPIASTVVIMEAHDVIFLEVAPALNLNDDQSMRAGVFDPV